MGTAKNITGTINGNPSLAIYLSDMNRIPMLSREEEVAVAKKIKNGNEDAVDSLVRANLRFVVSIARQYSNQGVPLEDLINEGNLGLIKAARRFDVDRGFKFITYAVWWIRQAILQSLADQSRVVRLPMNRASALYRITRTSRQLTQDLGREPSSAEIAKELKLPEDQVRLVLSVASAPVSLDDPLPGDSNTRVMDTLADETHEIEDETDATTLDRDMQRALATLTERERLVLCKYFGLAGHAPQTLEAIGGELGLTRERIRQIREKALQRLRHQSRAQFFSGYVQSKALHQ